MKNLRWWALVLLGVASLAHAQYKYVGPDGTVTYSDQPPPSSVKDVEVRNFATGAPAQSLPFELRQAMSRFPVTIYSTSSCSPCDEARKFMRTRGIPYSEKTVTSQDEIDAMTKVSKEGVYPVLVVGRQHSAGFDQTAWSAMLDDASYPTRSVLPPTYQNPAPEALIPSAPSTSTAVGQAAPAAPSVSAPAANAPGTPAGFHF